MRAGPKTTMDLPRLNVQNEGGSVEWRQMNSDAQVNHVKRLRGSVRVVVGNTHTGMYTVRV